MNFGFPEVAQAHPGAAVQADEVGSVIRQLGSLVSFDMAARAGRQSIVGLPRHNPTQQRMPLPPPSATATLPPSGPLLQAVEQASPTTSWDRTY